MKTADEIRALLPAVKYPDLPGLVKDIRRAIRKAYPECEKIERDTRPFEAMVEPGKPLDGLMAFRPDDSGAVYYIAIVDGRVEKVSKLEFKAAW